MEKKPKARLSWAAALLLVAVLCTGAYFLARQIVFRGTTAFREAIALPARPGQNIQTLGDGLLYHDGTTLHALNARGKQIWSYTTGSGADYDVDVGGVAAWTGTLLTLIRADGTTLYSGNVEDTVLTARLGTMYAAVQIGTEHESSVLILESSGRQVDKIDFANKTVLDCGFFSGGSLFWILTLDTEGTTPMCSVSTYKPGKMLAGTISDSEQILYQVLFQASRIRAVGTTYIKSFDYTAKEIASDRQLIYGWYMMDLDAGVDNPLMAFAPISQTEGEISISDVRMVKGTLDTTIRLPKPCFKLLAKNDAVLGFAPDSVMICRLGERRPTTYSLPVPAEDVLGMTDAGAAVVVSRDVVYLIPML